MSGLVCIIETAIWPRRGQNSPRITDYLDRVITVRVYRAFVNRSSGRFPPAMGGAGGEGGGEGRGISPISQPSACKQVPRFDFYVHVHVLRVPGSGRERPVKAADDL